MKKRILTFLIIFFCLLFTITSFKYINLNISNNSINNNIVTNNTNEKPVISIDNKNEQLINTYINQYNNQDVVGELKILNTNYTKAIMQSSNNDYYLNHLEDKTSSFMGSIYLDFRINIETDNKLLIFGHNSETIEMPFKILENYYNKDYYNNHKYIQITTKSNIRTYEIYAVLVEPTDFTYMKTNFENKEQWYNHIKTFKDKSMYNTNIDINENDNIIILQTCSYHYNYRMYDKKYLLVVGKEIK